MPLAGAGHTSSEGDVVELAAIVFQQDCCFCAVDAGIAITEQEIQVAVIVEIADRATHSAPAASETKVGSDVGECAIAVVAKGAQLQVRGLVQAEQSIKASVDPSEPKVQVIVEMVRTPP